MAQYVVGAALIIAGAIMENPAMIASGVAMMASAVIAKAFAQNIEPNWEGSSASMNPGNRQQVPPATDNKLPVIYGEAYIGGTVVDLSITSNNQVMYYVLALSEVTNTNEGQTPDTFSFGKVYFGGKKVLFNSDGFTVRALLDESTGVEDPTVNGKIAFYFYSNGSYTPTNQSLTAIQVMQDPGLIYKWDDTKLMSNCAFVIMRLTYNQAANIRGLEQTKFQVFNSRKSTGDCFYDYLTNTRYGAAIPYSQIDVDSLAALTAYSNQVVEYTDWEGNKQYFYRFQFNGVLSTAANIMENIQHMAACCDCLVTYNEILAKWGVITQTPYQAPVMDLNDSNLISSIQISPLDAASSYNVAEVKFPDNSNQDSFNSATFDLAKIDPSLLYPNEAVNKVSVSLPLINSDVQAQYLAIRLIKSTREDLQVLVDVNFEGLQLTAGDVVTITNANYGWVAKLFRINKVVQTFNEDGSIACKLTLGEFNPQVYDDADITQFQPSPNSGIGAPDFFGNIPAPFINNLQRSAPIPSFDVNVTVSSAGITQYAEIWYSAFQHPTESQRIFAGVTQVQSAGNPYEINSLIPPVTLTNIPFGDWYFFSRMVNSLGSSDYSPASIKFEWRPLTYQYTERYLCVAYADDQTGLNFSFSPRNKLFYGLQNTPSANPSTIPSDYTWYLAEPPFNPIGYKSIKPLNAVVEDTQNNYLLFTTRGSRKVSLSIGNAIYFNGLGGTFVPSESGIYDQTIWEGLPDGENVIDLDLRTGQNTKYGTSSVSQADGLLSVSNNTSGAMTVALQKFLNFGNGVYSKTFTTQQLTVDVFGRVVGFSDQDLFFFTDYTYVSSAGQTQFAIQSDNNSILVFANGELLSTTDYVASNTFVTLNTSPITGTIIYIMEMRAVASSNYHCPLNSSVVTRIDNSTFTYNIPMTQLLNPGDILAFGNDSSDKHYPVVSIDYTTRTVVVDTTSHDLPTPLAGGAIFLVRDASVPYAVFNRITIDVNQINSFTPTQIYVRNGFEQLYVNGIQFNEIDYDLKQNTFNGFPAPFSGTVELIVFSANNLNIPCSNITNTVTYSKAGEAIYPFTANPLAMEIYANGVNLVEGTGYDYIADTIAYTMITPFQNNNTLLNQQTFARDGAA